MPSFDLGSVTLYNTTTDENLRIVLYELTVKDPLNGVEYDVALVSTRRGLTIDHVQKKTKAEQPTHEV